MLVKGQFNFGSNANGIDSEPVKPIQKESGLSGTQF